MATRKEFMQGSLDTLISALVLSLSAEAAEAQAPEKPATPPAGGTQPKQDAKKDPQSSFEPRSAPGFGQRLMEKMVGEWNVAKTISPPGRPAMRTKGTCHQSMVHGGRFLKSEFIFEEHDGSKTTGLGLLGYDPARDVFSSVWTDSRSTRMSLRQSEGKFNGTDIELHSRTMENGGTDMRHSRTNAHLEDDGRTLIHRQYSQGPDGKEFVIMELYMTRK